MTGEGPPAAASAGGVPRTYCLIVENATSGNAPGRTTPPPARFELTARETIVGRDPSCAVRLDDLFVSRRHARLLLRGSDLHLDDLASTNVTRRNGEAVRTRVRLQPGDVLHFASVRARLVEVSPDAPEGPPIPPPPAEPPAGGEADGPAGGAGPTDGAAEGAAAPAPAPTAAAAAAAAAPEAPTSGGSAPPVAGEGTTAVPGAGAPGGVAPPEGPDRAAAADRRDPAGASDRAGGRPGRGPTEPQPKEPEPPGAAPPGAGIEREPAPGSEPRPERNPEVFVAGPLPGEAGRARVRAALWLAALTALAALGAALLR